MLSGKQWWVAILPARLDNLPILVLNVSNEACEINAETVLAELSLANCAKKTTMKRI